MPKAHLDTTANIRGSAKRNTAFTLQHGAMLTPRQPDRRRAEAALWRAAKAEGCVPGVVSGCIQMPRRELYRGPALKDFREFFTGLIAISMRENRLILERAL